MCSIFLTCISHHFAKCLGNSLPQNFTAYHFDGRGNIFSVCVGRGCYKSCARKMQKAEKGQKGRQAGSLFVLVVY